MQRADGRPKSLKIFRFPLDGKERRPQPPPRRVLDNPAELRSLQQMLRQGLSHRGNLELPLRLMLVTIHSLHLIAC